MHRRLSRRIGAFRIDTTISQRVNELRREGCRYGSILLCLRCTRLEVIDEYHTRLRDLLWISVLSRLLRAGARAARDDETDE